MICPEIWGGPPGVSARRGARAESEGGGFEILYSNAIWKGNEAKGVLHRIARRIAA